MKNEDIQRTPCCHPGAPSENDRCNELDFPIPSGF